jgi:hypothetical protein
MAKIMIAPKPDVTGCNTIVARLLARLAGMLNLITERI